MTRLRDLVDKVAAAHSRHRERHRPSGFGFLLADRIAYIEPGQWDAATAGASVFLGRRYLSALERHPPEGLVPRYAVVFRDHTPVAALSTQLVQVAATRVARVRALKFLEERFLVCGNLLSWGPHGVAFAPNEDPATLWPAVAEAIYRIRRADKLSGQTDFTLVKDFRADAPGIDALGRFGYRPIETEPDMVLTLAPSWRTFDDYLAGLDGKYRKAARKVCREVEAAGLRVEPLVDLAEEAAAMHALYLEVHQSARIRPVTIAPGFLAALATALGDDFRATAVWQERRLCGFVTSIRDGDTAIGYYLGVDRKLNDEVPIYHRLLQATIEHALALGCRRLSLGRTALEAKARLGAIPVPLQVWARHRQPLVNVALRPLLEHIPHDVAPERNPFRGAAKE